MVAGSQNSKRVALAEKPLEQNKPKTSSVAAIDVVDGQTFKAKSMLPHRRPLKRQIYHDADLHSEENSPDASRGAKRLKCDCQEDLDLQDKEDVTMCYDYSNDIFSHLYKRQFTTTPKIDYLKDREYEFYLRPSMRSILVDWLIEVHCKFHLLPETLYLAINLMDRYLSFNQVTLPRLQLIAISSLLIAAKFEEVNLPKLSNYSYITDNAYSNDEIKQAEFVILNKLQYNIGWPNPVSYTHLDVYKRQL